MQAVHGHAMVGQQLGDGGAGTAGDGILLNGHQQPVAGRQVHDQRLVKGLDEAHVGDRCVQALADGQRRRHAAAECEQGRVIGFDGKTLIHPSQIETANRVFSPSDAEVTHALAVIEAFALPENKGKGVISLDGQMVERLHLAQARRLVAINDHIQQSLSSGDQR